MKLVFNANRPCYLRKSIIEIIEQEELNTWMIHTHLGRKYLKHTGQWGEKGVINIDCIDIGETMTVEVLKLTSSNVEIIDFEGYYLGRFCELMFVNFPNRFTSIDKE
ncbi:MAG: hypothetical protein FGM14_10965 [Flavobacteriales bacterium]|nr:hypothetical protein [Flavobacteriales bacterium]